MLQVLLACALIAVLVGIALPTYNSYVTRSRLGEAISLASTAKLALGEACTGAYLNSANNTSLRLPDAAVFASSKVVSSIEASGTSATQAKIEVKLKAIGSLKSDDFLLFQGVCNPATGLAWTLSGSRPEITKLVQ